MKIKKIKYLIPPRDIYKDGLDVFVSLEDDYCTDDFSYIVEVTTPQFLSTIMEREKSAFLSPAGPLWSRRYRVHLLLFQNSKLTDDGIRAAIESFINSDDEDGVRNLFRTMKRE